MEAPEPLPLPRGAAKALFAVTGDREAASELLVPKQLATVPTAAQEPCTSFVATLWHR